jgi:GT2 family glycosyltransferase
MIDVLIPTRHAKREDGREYLDVLLESLQENSVGEVNIMVNDDPDGDYVSKTNALWQRARNDVVLMNDDIIVPPGWDRLVSEASGDIRGFKLLYPNGLLQHYGGQIRGDFVGCHPEGGTIDLGQYGGAHRVPFVTFAVAYIPRRVYEAVGYLDDCLGSHFFVDADYCLRGWQMGFETWVSPAPFVHFEGVTVNADPQRQERWASAYARFRQRWASEDTLNMLMRRFA